MTTDIISFGIRLSRIKLLAEIAFRIGLDLKYEAL